MKKLKQLACGFLAAALLVCALPARAQATGENYVEVAMTSALNMRHRATVRPGAQRRRNRQ